MNHTPKPKSSDSRRWRKALRAIGTTRLQLIMSERSVGPNPEAPVFGVVNAAPHPARAFVEAWLVARKRRVGAYPVAIAVFVAAAALGIIAWENWGTISHLVRWP